MPTPPTLDLDLARTSVFLDFDGTITTADVGTHLLERTASAQWWDLHEQYERGENGSRECIYDQWALVEGAAGSRSTPSSWCLEFHVIGV